MATVKLLYVFAVTGNAASTACESLCKRVKSSERGLLGRVSGTAAPVAGLRAKPEIDTVNDKMETPAGGVSMAVTLSRALPPGGGVLLFLRPLHEPKPNMAVDKLMAIKVFRFIAHPTAE
jgi:hypothetical protein